MKTIRTLILACSLILTSCGNHDYLDLPNPDGTLLQNPGRLIATINGLPQGSATASLIEPATDRLIATVSPSQPVDVEAGTYLLRYLNPLPEGATLHDATLTLPVITDAQTPSGAQASSDDANPIPQAPANLSGGIVSVTITANQSTSATLTIAPLSRSVQLDAALIGADISAIRSIEARLYGVARTAQLDSGYTPQTRASLPTYYVRTALETTPGGDNTDPIVSGTFWLLGTDTSQPQRILITATLANGDTISYDEDVTAFFSGFNPPAVNNPLHLAATLNFGIDEVTGTIEPWKPGWEEGGTGL